MNEQVWWFVARASGVVAWALASASVLWGLALSTRALGAKPRAPWLLDLHRFLGGLTVAFVGVHLAALVADSYVHWGAADLLVPLAASWKPLATAAGIVAFYLLVAVELTSLVMDRLPRAWWKAVHLTAYGVFALGTIHLLTAGTDRSNPILLGAVVASVASVAFFTVYRVIGPGRAASVRPTPARPRRPPGVDGRRPTSGTPLADA